MTKYRIVELNTGYFQIQQKVLFFWITVCCSDGTDRWHSLKRAQDVIAHWNYQEQQKNTRVVKIHKVEND